MAKTNTTVRTINGKGLLCDIWLSRNTPNLDGAKIPHLLIDRVYPTYVHYEKFKEKPTYTNVINSCL